ncbi:MAG: TIGR02556 family CRISPR-associated protein [Spirochaetales bacterium]|nr:TIGR02556 family CRISPR-associated protein [Spirochaetales bacterium]
MIHKLHKLYDAIPEGWFASENPLNLNLGYDKGKIALIKIDEKAKKYTYSGIQVEDYDKSKNKTKYLFEDFDKLPGSNSTPSFPTYRIFPAGNKSPDVLCSKGLNKIVKSLLNNTMTNEIADVVENNKEKIKDFLLDAFTFKEPFLLSVLIDNEYVAKSDYFKTLKKNVKNEKYISYYSLLENKKYVPYTGENKECNLCKTRKENVWGYVSTFNFYAVKTELAPIAGGFDSKKAWKNYPVCRDCAIKLDKTKAILDSYFTFSFYGLQYYLIPEFLVNDPDNKEILDIFYENEFGNLSLKKDKRKRLTDAEDEVLELLTQTENKVNYTLFFFEVNKAEFKILISIDNVFPSRFREIFNAKDSVENYDVFPFFSGLPAGKDKPLWDLRFNFGIIRTFFPNTKKEGNFNKYFLEITRSIFLSKKIDYFFLLHRIITVIQIKFINEENYYFDLLKALMLISFIETLNLFKNKQSNKEKEVILENKFEDFLKKHSAFFDSNTKKAIFLEGVLCQFLLNIQKRERGAAPFRSRLNSLKLNVNIIKRLLPEMIEKLEQYNKNYYMKLEEAISKYMVDASFDLSNDEMSFYFVMGMCLCKEFKTGKEEETDE